MTEVFGAKCVVPRTAQGLRVDSENCTCCGGRVRRRRPQKLARRPWPLVQTASALSVGPRSTGQGHKPPPPMKVNHVGKDWSVYLSPHYIGGRKWGNRSWWVSFQAASTWLNHAGNSSGKTLNLATSVISLMFQLLTWELLLLVVVYFCVYLPAMWWSDCVLGFPTPLLFAGLKPQASCWHILSWLER